jgi:hypothetical protein
VDAVEQYVLSLFWLQEAIPPAVIVFVMYQQEKRNDIRRYQFHQRQEEAREGIRGPEHLEFSLLAGHCSTLLILAGE